MDLRTTDPAPHREGSEVRARDRVQRWRRPRLVPAQVGRRRALQRRRPATAMPMLWGRSSSVNRAVTPLTARFMRSRSRSSTQPPAPAPAPRTRSTTTPSAGCTTATPRRARRPRRPRAPPRASPAGQPGRRPRRDGDDPEPRVRRRSLRASQGRLTARRCGGRRIVPRGAPRRSEPASRCILQPRHIGLVVAPRGSSSARQEPRSPGAIKSTSSYCCAP
jgi:hypothetical protein